MQNLNNIELLEILGGSLLSILFLCIIVLAGKHILRPRLIFLPPVIVQEIREVVVNLDSDAIVDANEQKNLVVIKPKKYRRSSLRGIRKESNEIILVENLD